MILRLLCIFSVLSVCSLKAQTLRFTQMRIGTDILYDASYLFPKKPIKDYLGNYRNWEGSVELIGPYKLSFVGEFGQTTLEANVAKNTLIYNSNGYYMRFGCNFDLTDTKKKYEFDLGWRLGLSTVKESARVAFYGDYWDSQLNFPLASRTNNYFFGQIMAEYKARIFKNAQGPLKDLWFGMSMRIRINASSIGKQEYDTPIIPGYGLNNVASFIPSFQSTLFYVIHFTKGTLHKSHHLNNNYDIIEKNHHYYRVKRHKVVADDAIRD